MGPPEIRQDDWSEHISEYRGGQTVQRVLADIPNVDPTLVKILVVLPLVQNLPDGQHGDGLTLHACLTQDSGPFLGAAPAIRLTQSNLRRHASIIGPNLINKPLSSHRRIGPLRVDVASN